MIVCSSPLPAGPVRDNSAHDVCLTGKYLSFRYCYLLLIMAMGILRLKSRCSAGSSATGPAGTVNVAIGKLIDNSTLGLIYEAVTHHKQHFLP